VVVSISLMAKRMALRSVAALMAIGAGCGGNSIDLPHGQVWTSAHFRYTARADDHSVCDGVVDRLEAHFAALHAYLGIDWPGGMIDYYKFRDQADLDAHSQCALLADACRIGSGIQSPRVLHGHELIHVYTMRLGHPPPMFEEGLAEALSPEGRGFLEPNKTWQEVLGAPPRMDGVPASIAYWGGAWFVAYLLRHHDVKTFLAFYAAVPATAAEAEVAAAFQQAYGVALDDEWQRALTDDPDEKGVPIWECAADPMTLGGAAADLSDRCDGRGSFATFDLSAETSLAWYDDELSNGFNVASCAVDSVFHVLQIGWTGALETGALSLPTGRYYVAPMVGSGTIGLQASANAVAVSCADAAPLLLPATARNLTLVIGDGPDARYVMPQHPDKTTFELARQWDDPIVANVMMATVEVCSDCSSSCVPFDNSVATNISNGQILRITGLNAPPGATVVRFGYQ
jgi:hypothetical protein